MNISSVSFGKNSEELIYTPEFVKIANDSAGASKLERIPEKDNFTPQKTKKTKHKGFNIKSFLAGVAATLLVNAGVSQINTNTTNVSVTIPFDDTVSISEVAALYDVDEEAILTYNNITEETNLDELTSLDIPVSYDYLQEKIDSLQNKLYNSNLSEEERAEIEEKITEYTKKQEYQNELATVYTDGKYVYYKLKEVDENSSAEIYDNYKYGINVETFKNIFDIKDGAIKSNNDLTYTIYQTGPSDTPESYRDYTGNKLKAGDVVKVPVSAIKTENITLDY